MPLTDTRTYHDTIVGQIASGADGTGRNVVVEASAEVIKAKGWGHIWLIASDKYDRGQVERTGKTTSKVTITTDDFKPVAEAKPPQRHPLVKM